MTQADLYEMWAPARSAWSAWAKPVLFATLDPMSLGAMLQAPPALQSGPPVAPPPPSPPAVPVPPDASWAPDPAGETAIVVDLDGAESVAMAISLARRGYRPVPVFNGNDGPGALIEMGATRAAIASFAAELSAIPLVDDASPAFLLDARRAGTGLPLSPGKFDNRWMCFPQDFPSGNLLRSRGIRRAIVARKGAAIPDDLRHVLLRWQEAGISIALRDLDAGSAVQEITVTAPPRFRSLLYRLFAVMGFRRSAAGGFGSVIPLPSQGGGGYH